LQSNRYKIIIIRDGRIILEEALDFVNCVDIPLFISHKAVLDMHKLYAIEQDSANCKLIGHIAPFPFDFGIYIDEVLMKPEQKSFLTYLTNSIIECIGTHPQEMMMSFGKLMDLAGKSNDRIKTNFFIRSIFRPSSEKQLPKKEGYLRVVDLD